MLFMIRVSLQLMPLILLDYRLWIGLVILGLAAWLGSRRGEASTTSGPDRSRLLTAIEILLMIALPLSILGWGLYFWDSAHGSHEGFAQTGLNLMAVVQACGCTFVAWHRRGRLAWVFGATMALWWTASALGTGAMAITNKWL